jgi:signal transduction histidine kinase
MAQQGIMLSQIFDRDIPLILGDGRYLQQVFLNIILNAVDAMPRSGSLTIIGKNEPYKVSISITDTGCGIPAKNLERIFDPFFTTKSVGEGTGLGLSVSLGIVKEHRGEIRVESEVDKGSTFTVILPVRSEKE